jgi:hypothetical protein
MYWYTTYVSLNFPPFMTTNGTSIWHPAAVKLGHIGSTAIWPWNYSSNPRNRRNPHTGERRPMPADSTKTPFLAQNGTYNMTVMTYTESHLSISHTFSDFIGLPNLSVKPDPQSTRLPRRMLLRRSAVSLHTEC